MCRSAVSVGRSGDPRAAGAFAAGLRADATRLSGTEDGALGAFLSALAGLLEGEDGEALAAGLAPPFAAGLRMVAADLARPAEEEDAVDWVAGLAARVAVILRRRDREGARALSEELDAILAAPDLEPAAALYLRTLREVLSGRDVRHRIPALEEPYRSAYLSLESVLRGTDPRAGLIERLEHNAGLVIERDDPRSRAGLAAALAELRAEAGRTGELDLAGFIDAVAALIDGHPPQPAPPLRDAALAQSWSRLAERWEAAGRPGAQRPATGDGDR